MEKLCLTFFFSASVCHAAPLISSSTITFNPSANQDMMWLPVALQLLLPKLTHTHINLKFLLSVWSICFRTVLQDALASPTPPQEGSSYRKQIARFDFHTRFASFAASSSPDTCIHSYPETNKHSQGRCSQTQHHDFTRPKCKVRETWTQSCILQSFFSFTVTVCRGAKKTPSLCLIFKNLYQDNAAISERAEEDASNDIARSRSCLIWDMAEMLLDLCNLGTTEVNEFHMTLRETDKLKRWDKLSWRIF